MRRCLLTFFALAVLAGCSGGMPSFLGREVSQSGTYTIGGEDLPEGALDPVPMPVSTAVAERALHGVILRAETVAPTQGYYAAALTPATPDGRPDENGILTARLTALAPTTPQATGPEPGRTLAAALFIQNVTLSRVKSFRVLGAPNSIAVPLPR